jgi:hypothetical protein
VGNLYINQREGIKMGETQMEELFDKIDAKCQEFAAQSRKAINGNKSAGVRSRKLSLEITAMLKQWRVVSNPESVRD